jgi:hypothetical protein
MSKMGSDRKMSESLSQSMYTLSTCTAQHGTAHSGTSYSVQWLSSLNRTPRHSIPKLRIYLRQCSAAWQTRRNSQCEGACAVQLAMLHGLCWMSKKHAGGWGRTTRRGTVCPRGQPNSAARGGKLIAVLAIAALLAEGLCLLFSQGRVKRPDAASTATGPHISRDPLKHTWNLIQMP